MAGIRIGVLTSSDTRSKAEDTAGRALVELAEARGWRVIAYELKPDDRVQLGDTMIEMSEAGADVVFTCGGTGLGPRDVTPEATRDVVDNEVPGIAEHIRAESMKVTKRAMLSRATAGVRGGRTLFINMPGSEKAARESFSFVADQLEHAVEMMAGGGHG